MQNVNNADVYTDFNGLAKLKNDARKESPEALKEVAKQFESIFINNVLKGMREAKLAEGILDNDQSKFYNDMYDQQLAVHLAGKPGIGLADLIVKQMRKEEPEDKQEKLETEDFLNRSSSADKGSIQHTHAGDAPAAAKAVQPGSEYQDGAVTISSYPHDTSKLKQDITPITAKGESAGPIRSAEQFVRQLQPYAEQAAKELGVEPKAILAQAALESGWGKSLIKTRDGESSFNVFNIKADKSWQGPQAKVSTLEFDHGVAQKVNAGFRTYGSFKESFNDYVDFIKSNPRYQQALKQAGNTQRYMHELQQAGYATDPRYAEKVMSIYQSNSMSAMDEIKIASTESLS
ncbi:MAG: flagellar assembly peptidoglycan hydrolase FlgJ [Methylococcaceae bacterium]|nr:flagellar assembly peptidoglycan hydrolase FlgJ [Methylococcaceae bacterium]MDZ4156966.1 flagellar assembly peptidoglycan hydrolase FlgJ [Methylococcales bacterium]MDP2393986.1 flagellar assembly peptidoglycan hydrolase FlgJ [Methylococcaceae bacterium]MDP3018550.1 flagellar assembly peptidoglycan hydrolase FlgJ [Methylococcaceae bacterium]MDP3391305.1 flagellar assembly peptidoglycan hydrolase FlgJ [Methylococcaceae bacterium]